MVTLTHILLLIKRVIRQELIKLVVHLKAMFIYMVTETIYNLL